MEKEENEIAGSWTDLNETFKTKNSIAYYTDQMDMDQTIRDNQKCCCFNFKNGILIMAAIIFIQG